MKPRLGGDVSIGEVLATQTPGQKLSLAVPRRNPLPGEEGTPGMPAIQSSQLSSSMFTERPCHKKTKQTDKSPWGRATEENICYQPLTSTYTHRNTRSHACTYMKIKIKLRGKADAHWVKVRFKKKGIGFLRGQSDVPHLYLHTHIFSA